MSPRIESVRNSLDAIRKAFRFRAKPGLTQQIPAASHLSQVSATNCWSAFGSAKAAKGHGNFSQCRTCRLWINAESVSNTLRVRRISSECIWHQLSYESAAVPQRKMSLPDLDSVSKPAIRFKDATTGLAPESNSVKRGYLPPVFKAFKFPSHEFVRYRRFSSPTSKRLIANWDVRSCNNV